MKPDHARAFIDAVKEWQWTEERLAKATTARALAGVP
jgi:hypothetical protein